MRVLSRFETLMSASVRRMREPTVEAAVELQGDREHPEPCGDGGAVPGADLGLGDPGADDTGEKGQRGDDKEVERKLMLSLVERGSPGHTNAVDAQLVPSFRARR